MTPQEFQGPFALLCRGLEFQATSEQLGAWYRRIGHLSRQVWGSVVDSLLFDGRKGYLPKLDHVLDVVEREAESCRRIAVEQDKFKAKKAYVLLSQPVDPTEQSRIPRPGTPLFACIKAFTGRKQAQAVLAGILSSERLDEEEQQWRVQRLQLKAAILEYTREINELSPLLHEEDAGRLVQEYETTVAV